MSARPAFVRRLRLSAFAAFIAAAVVTVTSCAAFPGAGGSNAAAGIVVVYSSNNADINNPIVKEFQERTGIQVELVSGGTGELLKRVEAERERPQADVFFGGDTASLAAYRGLFEPYSSSEKPNLDPDYWAEDDFYTPFTLLPMVIMYNKDLVSEEEKPRSWSDLADPKWKGRIAYADPGKSSSSFVQLAAMLSVFGKDNGAGWTFVERFAANLDGKLLASSGLVYQGVADKEFAVGLTLEEAALRYVEGGAPVGVVYPAEGTVAPPDGMAIVKGAVHAKNAQAFIDFAAGSDVQHLLQNEFLRRSVRLDAAGPANMPDLADVPMIPYDGEWASSHKAEIAARFARLMGGER